MIQLEVKSKERVHFIDITRQVQDALSEAGMLEGVCCLYVPHTTAAVTINENADADVVRDMRTKLAALIPQQDNYRHYEGNSDAHLKASIFGFATMVPVSAGQLFLGTWQSIYFCDFDGPRKRQVVLRMMGSDGNGVMRVW